jgi:uncharacterized SAM-binding protein YcdF (DUF218 family)
MLIVVLLLPPGSLIVLALVGWAIRRWHVRAGSALIVASVVLLYLMSTPAGAYFLIRGLQRAPIEAPTGDSPGAIVVLSAGEAPDERGGMTVDGLSLERLRRAAELARRTHLPILAAGGVLRSGGAPLALLMQTVLERDFRVPVAWLDLRSENTAESAVESAAILRGVGIDKVFLVTHAWHMPRARQAFVADGIRVVAAPVAPVAPGDPLNLPDLLPRARALWISSFAVHEWLGILWYRLHYGYPWPT